MSGERCQVFRGAASGLTAIFDSVEQENVYYFILLIDDALIYVQFYAMMLLS